METLDTDGPSQKLNDGRQADDPPWASLVNTDGNPPAAIQMAIKLMIDTAARPLVVQGRHVSCDNHSHQMIVVLRGTVHAAGTGTMCGCSAHTTHARQSHQFSNCGTGAEFYLWARSDWTERTSCGPVQIHGNGRSMRAASPAESPLVRLKSGISAFFERQIDTILTRVNKARAGWIADQAHPPSLFPRYTPNNRGAVLVPRESSKAPHPIGK